MNKYLTFLANFCDVFKHSEPYNSTDSPFKLNSLTCSLVFCKIVLEVEMGWSEANACHALFIHAFTQHPFLLLGHAL